MGHIFKANKPLAKALLLRNTRTKMSDTELHQFNEFISFLAYTYGDMKEPYELIEFIKTLENGRETFNFLFEQFKTE